MQSVPHKGTSRSWKHGVALRLRHHERLQALHGAEINALFPVVPTQSTRMMRRPCHAGLSQRGSRHNRPRPCLLYWRKREKNVGAGQARPQEGRLSECARPSARPPTCPEAFIESRSVKDLRSHLLICNVYGSGCATSSHMDEAGSSTYGPCESCSPGKTLRLRSAAEQLRSDLHTACLHAHLHTHTESSTSIVRAWKCHAP